MPLKAQVCSPVSKAVMTFLLLPLPRVLNSYHLTVTAAKIAPAFTIPDQLFPKNQVQQEVFSCQLCDHLL